MGVDDNPHDLTADLAARVAALESRVGALRDEVRGLSAGMGIHGEPIPPAGVQAAPPAPGRGGPDARPRASLETRIGGQFLNRIGILAVLIGVAWFLKLAFDRNWIGPSLRVLIGLVLAAGLMVWSERFRRRGFAAFSFSLKALGTGVAYLSLWAASSVFHLAPTWLLFFAMIGVTAANAALAWFQESELLAMYALAGGLATPGLLASGLGNETFLFSYLTLLNLGALALVVLHGWTRIAWAALLGTGLYYIGWTLSAYSPGRLFLTEFFLCLFFALFAAVPFVLMRRFRGPVARPTDAAFTVAFPIANVAATWVALLALYGGAPDQAGRFWATLLLAVACLVLAWAARLTVSLSHTFLGLGILLVTAAFPLQFHGYVVTLFWLGESLLLILLARAWTHDALRVYGAGTLMIAGSALLLDWAVGTEHPLAVVINMHFATSLVGAAVFAAVTLISLRAQEGTPRSFAGWSWLAGFGSVAFSLTLLVAVSLEIHHYWFCGAGFSRDFCTGYGQLERRSITAGFGLSAWWMLYGAALMAVGFLRRSAFLRWQALVLLAVSIGKVFLNGVSSESQGYRVLSFLGLGVLLMAVSFAYQKDWLRLRG